MKNILKRKRKVLFVLIALFALMSTVYAYAATYSGEGNLSNEIKSGTSVKNDPIVGYISTRSTVTTEINDISRVVNLASSGGNAENGIRVFTTVYFQDPDAWIGIWKKQPEKGYQVVKPSTESTTPLEWDNDIDNNVKIEWQNRTGNTSFHGTFIAD